MGKKQRKKAEEAKKHSGILRETPRDEMLIDMLAESLKTTEI